MSAPPTKTPPAQKRILIVHYTMWSKPHFRTVSLFFNTLKEVRTYAANEGYDGIKII